MFEDFSSSNDTTLFDISVKLTKLVEQLQKDLAAAYNREKYLNEQLGKCWQGICLTQIVKTVLNKRDANKIRSFFDRHIAIIKDIIYNIKDQTKLDVTQKKYMIGFIIV